MFVSTLQCRHCVLVLSAISPKCILPDNDCCDRYNDKNNNDKKNNWEIYGHMFVCVRVDTTLVHYQ